jgi:hypothetical protein
VSDAVRFYVGRLAFDFRLAAPPEDSQHDGGAN